MTNLNGSLRFIDQFLAHFQPLFSNTQISALRAIVYGMFYDYKRLSLSAIARKTHIDIKNSNTSSPNLTGTSINSMMSVLAFFKINPQHAPL